MTNILVVGSTLSCISIPVCSSDYLRFYSVKRRLSSLYQAQFINFSRQIVASPSSLTTMSNSNSHSSSSRVSVQTDETGSTHPRCTDVIIVRHGETDWNALAKLQGQLDVELNETGRRQAVAVAERLSMEPNISAIYSSDLKRAFETAEIIASKFDGLQVMGDQDLRERHLGALQGHVYQELARLTPKAYEAFKSRRSDQEIPGGGESLDQLYERCTIALQRIGEKHRGERVIVVSHGGVIRSLYNRADVKGHHSGKISNTSVGIIQLFEGDMWSIKSWNDVGHLRQTGYLASAFGGDATSG